MPLAQQLYTRFGFKHIYTRRRCFRDGVDALAMRRKLNPDETTTPEAQQP